MRHSSRAVGKPLDPNYPALGAVSQMEIGHTWVGALRCGQFLIHGKHGHNKYVVTSENKTCAFL